MLIYPNQRLRQGSLGVLDTDCYRRDMAPVVSTASLQDFAAAADEHLRDASAAEVIQWAHETFGEKFVLTASMADGVLCHVASKAVPGIKVLFLDTGYHFAETVGTRDAIAATYDVEVVTVSNPVDVSQHEVNYGKLHASYPDLCCAIRKVWPLDQALRQFDAWASGMRRAESSTRRTTPVVGWDARRKKVKINPLATWSNDQVDRYITEHNILVNPLREIGYSSIGCEPCTRPVAVGEDPRAGRWDGYGKSECGIH